MFKCSSPYSTEQPALCAAKVVSHYDTIDISVIIRYNLVMVGGITAGHSIKINAGLHGLDYIASKQKEAFDNACLNTFGPICKVVSYATELAIYGSLNDSHRFVQERDGRGGGKIQVEKVKTMCDVPEGIAPDVNRYSPRIVNWRAQIARIVGLDELPQWALVESGEMSVVGPRPMLPTCKDRLSKSAREAGASCDEIEEWRDLLRVAKPGIFGRSQAFRHKVAVEEFAPPSAYLIVLEDLDFKANDSVLYDMHAITTSVGTTLIEGIRHGMVAVSNSMKLDQ